MNLDINIFENYSNCKNSFEKEIEINIKNLNRIYHKNISIKELSEPELFDLYLCEQKCKTTIKRSLIDFKISVKSIYLPYLIGVLGIIATYELSREIRENILFYLILIIFIVITSIFPFYKKYKKEIERICNYELTISKIELIKRLKKLKYD